MTGSTPAAWHARLYLVRNRFSLATGSLFLQVLHLVECPRFDPACLWKSLVGFISPHFPHFHESRCRRHSDSPGRSTQSVPHTTQTDVRTGFQSATGDFVSSWFDRRSAAACCLSMRRACRRIAGPGSSSGWVNRNTGVHPHTFCVQRRSSVLRLLSSIQSAALHTVTQSSTALSGCSRPYRGSSSCSSSIASAARTRTRCAAAYRSTGSSLNAQAFTSSPVLHPHISSANNAASDMRPTSHTFFQLFVFCPRFSRVALRLDRSNFHVANAVLVRSLVSGQVCVLACLLCTLRPHASTHVGGAQFVVSYHWSLPLCA